MASSSRNRMFNLTPGRTYEIQLKCRNSNCVYDFYPEWMSKIVTVDTLKNSVISAVFHGIKVMINVLEVVTYTLTL